MTIQSEIYIGILTYHPDSMNLKINKNEKEFDFKFFGSPGIFILRV